MTVNRPTLGKKYNDIKRKVRSKISESKTTKSADDSLTEFTVESLIQHLQESIKNK